MTERFWTSKMSETGDDWFLVAARLNGRSKSDQSAMVNEYYIVRNLEAIKFKLAYEAWKRGISPAECFVNIVRDPDYLEKTGGVDFAALGSEDEKMRELEIFLFNSGQVDPDAVYREIQRLQNEKSE